MSTTDKAKKGSGLAARVITAVVALPVLGAVLFYGPSDAWMAIVFFAATVGLFEFYSMTMGEDDRVVAAMGTAVGSLLVLLIYFSPNSWFILAGLVTASLAVLFAVLFSYSSIERGALLIGAGIAGLIWVAVFTSFVALLRRDAGDLGPWWILLLLAIVWAGDTGAYFVGRALGRRKLAPVVSPNKSWEGAIGGTACSVAAAFAVVALTPIVLSPINVVALAIPASILGQVGDLCESLLKRSTGVKDSGKIVYGHGGILDRVDALIFAAPYVYFFFMFSSGALR